MTLNDFYRIVEIRTKIISVSAFLIGTLFAAYHAGEISPLIVLLMLGATLSVDMGTTGFNSYFDFKSGVDNARYNKECDKVLVHRGVGPDTALLISLGLFAAAGVLGLSLGYLVGWEIILVGAACMAVGFLYNAGPYPLSNTPLGELFAGGFLGFVLVALSYYVQTQSLDPAALLLGLPSLLLVASILTVNNTCDIEGDRAAGRHTLSILLGPVRAELIVYSLGAAGYAAALLVVLRYLPSASVLPLLAAATASAAEYRRMHARGYSHETKGASMQSISRVFMLYTLAMIVALILGLTIG
ncbi:MAG: prenyltransferase [Spirochaetaceae bacterium]|nr:MAG: prenyltransferase [Spirochaetaceae bacterium]